MYLEHIKVFNNFCEPDGSKNSPESFITAFDEIINNVKQNGFDKNIGLIPVNQSYDCLDGAHRVAACAYFSQNITVAKLHSNYDFNYKLFLDQNMDKDLADLAALEYCKLNKLSYVVNLHSCCDLRKDDLVENILNKYGFIFYKKNVFLNSDAYLYTKLISYGKEKWVGNFENNFENLRMHVSESSGTNPLRAYVFVCDDLNKVVKAKEEIRTVFNKGNPAVHINDNHEEAVELAQTYFNDNTLHFINSIKIRENKKINEQLNYFKKWIKEHSLNIDNLCAVGSFPMGLYNLRKTKDLDFIHLQEELPDTKREDISSHSTELKYYTKSKNDIIFDPKNHFYYKGVKIISLEVLLEMKEKRAEFPKDIDDIKLIQKVLKNSNKNTYSNLAYIKSFIFSKIQKTNIIIGRHWRCFKWKPHKYLENVLKGNF